MKNNILNFRDETKNNQSSNKFYINKLNSLKQLPEEKFNKQRLISTYLSVVVSISLVLFLTGIMGILLLNSKKVADHFKEQIAMTVYIKDTAKEIELKQLEKTLNLNLATKKVNFVSKKEASLRHANEIGEDFIEFLGFNPLMNSIDVYFKASFLNPCRNKPFLLFIGSHVTAYKAGKPFAPRDLVR